jgi:phospholipid/cholesterol/gamma-HCH transport system substrate-binding protein
MTAVGRWSRGPVSALVLAAAVTLSGCEAYDLPLPGSPVDEDESYELTAEFDSVLDLVPRSPVKVNDVTVGEIIEIRRVGWHAEAVLRVQDDVALPGNAIADIRQTSLLGEKYVALEEPAGQEGAGRLADGDKIGLDRTGRHPELEDVLGALALVLNGGGIGQLQTIIAEVNKVFNGRQDRVRHVLRELEVLMGGLDEQKQDIISAMEGMNGLAKTLNEQKRTITEAIDAFGPAVEVLADQRRGLMRMLKALDRLGVVGTRVINASKESLLADLRHLEPILREVANADDQMAEALGLAISFPFPIESNDIVKGDYANTEIVFSMDLHNLFANPGGPPGGGLPQLPELPKLPPAPELPDLPGAPGGGGGGGGGDGGRLPDVPGPGGAGPVRHDPATSSANTLEALLGGGRQ